MTTCRSAADGPRRDRAADPAAVPEAEPGITPTGSRRAISGSDASPEPTPPATILRA